MGKIELPPKIKYDIPEFNFGRGLEIGGKTFPHHIGVDTGDLKLFRNQAFDFVMINQHECEVIEAISLLKKNGYLIIVSDKREDLPGMHLLRKYRTGEMLWYHVYQKCHSKKIKSIEQPKCAVIRYGAFGDMMQTSSIFPHLKEQGYHVTLFCSKNGYDVVKLDPNVDKFIIQQKDQVPNVELDKFWEYQKTKYDKFINLSESVEASILAIPGRIQHTWPKETRLEYCAANYLELSHSIAQVPSKQLVRFYPNRDEIDRAKIFLKKLNKLKILWVLSGSSVHKTWPYLDNAIARILLLYPDSSIILTGDELCKMLQVGWENEKRVIKKAGGNIRDTLTLAKMVDVVIGPETGVMNAVGFEDVPKILFCSHSPPECVSKHWKNTTNLEPSTTVCYPCLQLHYTFDYCKRDEMTGVAQCQADIGLEQFFEAFTEVVTNGNVRIS